VDALDLDSQDNGEQPQVDDDDDSPAAFLRRQELARAHANPPIDPFLVPGGSSGSATRSDSVTASGGTEHGRKRQRVDNADSDDEEPEGVRKKRLHDMACLIKNSIPLSATAQSLLDMRASRSRRFGEMLDTALVLSLRDKLLAMEESWVVPDELMTDIKQYGWAYYLGPYTTAYRDTNEKIIVLLRKQNVKHLPDESSRGKMHTLTSAVTRQLTNIRAEIKAMIWWTLETSLRDTEVKQRKSKDKNPFESKRDVATLIHTIAHSTDVKVTYHHYTCFAFLRWAAVNFIQGASKKKDSDPTKTNYWIHCDTELSKVREQIPSSANQTAYFNDLLQRDQRKYGQVSGVDYAPHARELLPQWQLACEYAGVAVTEELPVEED